LLGKIPILTHIFSDGLVQPPTRIFVEFFLLFFNKKVRTSWWSWLIGSTTWLKIG